MSKTFFFLLLVSLGAGQTRERPNKRPVQKSEAIVIEAKENAEVTPEKAEQAPENAEETPKNAEETPKIAEETPKNAEETPKNADNDTSLMMTNMSWTYDVVQSSGKFCPERDKCR